MKDYSKLRPFDMEKFKAGERAIFLGGACPEVEIRTYVAGPDSSGAICAKDNSGRFLFVRDHGDYRLAPLAWVCKSADEDVLWPVYKGDVLWFVKDNFGIEVSGINDFDPGGLKGVVTKVMGNGRAGYKGDPDWITWAPFSCWTFTPPTPPKVKREGWINIYSQKSGGGIIYSSKREAEEAAVASGAVQLHIEWEE